jgi:hypothetical protein
MSAHRQRYIYQYHGTLPEPLKKILDYIACPDEESTTTRWFYDGGLDQFAEKWPSIFYVTKEGDIYVTQHDSWGAR